MTTKTETFDGEYSVNEELAAFEEQVLAAKDKPEAERIAVWTRLTAKFLHKRGALPTDLKKLLDN
jgi:hypothetical protein